MSYSVDVRQPIIFIGIVAALATGCVKNAEPQAQAPASQPAQPVATQPAGGGGGIAPLGPNVGGITPVAGAENVGGGGGGGVGMAAKDMARRTASGAGGPAGMNQMGAEGGE